MYLFIIFQQHQENAGKTCGFLRRVRYISVPISTSSHFKELKLHYQDRTGRNGNKKNFVELKHFIHLVLLLLNC